MRKRATEVKVGDVLVRREGWWAHGAKVTEVVQGLNKTTGEADVSFRVTNSRYLWYPVTRHEMIEVVQ